MASSEPSHALELAQLRALMDGAEVGLMLVDARAVIVEINARAATLLGAPVAALRGHPLGDWLGDGAEFVTDDARRAAFLAGAEPTTTLIARATARAGTALTVTLSHTGAPEQAMLSCVVRPYAAEDLETQRVQRIVETTRDGVWEIDTQAITTYVNAPMAAMLGYACEEMIGRSLFDFMDDAGRRVSEKNLERRRDGVAENHDFEFRRRDGTLVLCELETRPFTDADGHYAGATAIVRDVGAYRATVSALREVEARNRFFIDASLFGIWLAVLDAPMPLSLPLEEQLDWFLHQARFTVANEAMARLAGAPDPTVLVGAHFIDVWRHDLDRYFQQTRLIAQAQWSVDGLLLESLDLTGRRLFVQLSTTPRIVDGQLVEIWAAIIDVTRMIEADERYRLLAEEAPLGLLVLTEAMRIDYVNDTFARIVGRTREAIQAADADAVRALVMGDDQGTVDDAMTRRLAGQDAPLQYELRLLRPDGEVRIVEVHPRAIQNRGRRAVHIAAIDVTERRQAEQRMYESDLRYRAVVEGAVDAIFIVSAERVIIDCNPAACALMGAPREQLVGRVTSAFYRPDETVSERERTIQQHLLRARPVEHRIRRATGEEIDIEVSVSDLVGGHQLAIVRDIGRRKRTQRAINAIIEATVGAGDTFFRELVKSLCSVLGARMAMVGRLDASGDHVDVSACWQDGAWQQPFTYALPGTPCAQAITTSSCYYVRGVCEAFPEDAMLAAIGAQSYVGVRIRGENDEVLGILAIAHDAVIDDELLPQEVLQIFASRAAAEFERAAALDALRRAEGRWRSLIFSMPDYIALIEPDQRVTFVNRAAGDYTPETAANTMVLSWWHPDDHPRIKAALDRALVDQRVSEFEGRVIASDPPRLYSCVIGPIVHDGTVTGAVMVTRDVHERRMLEERERERDVLLRGISATAPFILYVFDRVTRQALFRNRTMAAALGYDESDSDGSPLAAFVHPDDRGIVRDWHLRWATVQDGEVVETRFRAIAADGSIRWYRARDVVFKRGADGAVTQVVGSVEDISERVAAEDARRDGEDRFRRIVERTGQVVYEHDVMTRKIAWGGAYTRVLGLDEAHIGDFDADQLKKKIHPEDRARVEALWRRCVEAGAAETTSYRFARDSGYVTLEDRVVYLAPAGDRPGRLLGAISDVSDARRLEDQLRASQRLDGVGRLAGGVAHDFNNLLTAVLGYAEIGLDEAAGQPSLVDSLEQIRSAAQRGASLASQLLSFARKQVIAPRVVDINVLVRNAAKLLAPLIGEDIETSYALSPTLGRVLLDATQFEQVFMNLAVNARDAMRDGGRLFVETYDVQVDLETRGHTAMLRPGPFVVLSVRDTGEGMSPEVQQRAFEPFFTTKEVGRGTGLGLATCYGIVTQAGGAIDVYSELGEGTTFKVYLPSVDMPLPPSAEPEPTTTAVGAETLLLVEDDELVRRMALVVLTRCGFQVLEASDGREGLALMRAHGHAVSLIVSDVVMPHLGGRAMVEAIRAEWPAVKVLFISGYTDNAFSDAAVLPSGIGFLQKPFSPTVLAERVRRMLDHG